VLFIDEAYGLDASYHNNCYGGDVQDTLDKKVSRGSGTYD